jgi:hypothetical protein
VVVDIRDSLYAEAFKSKVELSFEDRVIMGTRMSYWVSKGAVYILTIDVGAKILFCLSPESILFGEESAIVLVTSSSFYEVDENGIDALKPTYVRWTAPEVSSGDTKTPTEKSVVFSLAMITYCVVTATYPFKDVSFSDIKDQIVGGTRPSLGIFRSQCPPLGAIILSMWQGLPEQRITLPDVEAQMFPFSKEKAEVTKAEEKKTAGGVKDNECDAKDLKRKE